MATIASNQSIYNALLKEAATRENPYAKKAYEMAASKVSHADVDLTLDTTETSTWLQCLGPKTREFVNRFTELYTLKQAYIDTVRNDETPKPLFPPEWRNTISEEEFYIAVSLDPKSRPMIDTNRVDKMTLKEAITFYFKTIKYDTTRSWIFTQLRCIVDSM
jgi:hypothetical protein